MLYLNYSKERRGYRATDKRDLDLEEQALKDMQYKPNKLDKLVLRIKKELRKYGRKRS